MAATMCADPGDRQQFVTILNVHKVSAQVASLRHNSLVVGVCLGECVWKPSLPLQVPQGKSRSRF